MELEHVIAFNIALLAALFSPGPGMLVTIRNTLANGRRAGFATGIGLGTIAAGWTLAALFGLEAIFTLFPWAYVTLRIIGAAYLLYIAISIWHSARSAIDPTPISGRRAFVTGMLVNLGNPKSVLFAGAVLVVIFPAGLSTTEMSIIALNQILLEWTFYTCLVMVLSHGAISTHYLNAKPILDRVAATMLGALGLKLLTDR